MKSIAFLIAPVLGAIGVVAIVGCNTAQVTQPAQLDAGPACVDIPPVLSPSCDAGPPSAAPPPGACAGGMTISVSGLDASSTFPTRAYGAGCLAQFSTDDHAGGCLDSPSCTCVPADSGPGDDAGDDAGDAGSAVTPPGVWACKR